MLTVVVQSLLLASGGILSAGSITIVLLLLISGQGWRNGLAYTLGYTGAYTLIGLTVVLVGVRMAAGGSQEEMGPWLPVGLVALGTLLLAISLRNLRAPAGGPQEPPRLFRVVDNLTPTRAFGFGALVTVLNFKNLAIFLSAVAVPLVSDLTLPAKIVVVLLVVLVFCSAVIVPVLIYVVRPDRAQRRLTWLRETLESYRRPIGIWLPLIFGLLFLSRGLSELL